MKNILLIVLLLLCVFVSCQESISPINKNDFSIMFGETQIRLYEEKSVDSFLKLDIHFKMINSNSETVGIDNSQMRITLKKENDTRIVESILIKTNAYKSNRGIRVGDSIERLEEKYGKPKDIKKIDDRCFYYYKYEGRYSNRFEVIPILQFDTQKGIIVKITIYNAFQP